MKKKKIAIYLTTILLATCGVSIKIKKDKSDNFKNSVISLLENIGDDDFLISAHRGFSSLEVENTKQAILLAASKDYVDYIEIDARMTEDKKIVLSHNDALLDNKSLLKISSLSYDEATSIDFLYRSYYVNPYFCKTYENKFIQNRNKNLNKRKYKLIGLREGIKCCEDKKILLDLKFDDNKEEFTDELLNELEGLDISNIIFQSLDLESLKYFKEKTGYDCLALMNNKSDFKYLDEFDNYGIKYTLIDYEKVKEWIEDNKVVAIWTINNSNDFDKAADKLDDLYEDVIYITDNPDLIETKLYAKKTRD